MPEYIYTDASRHNVTITHRMLYSTSIVCAACGATMWRKPQAVAVNWSGLPPSKGELSPVIKQAIADGPRRRGEMEPKA